jgi:hypothetical protein
MIQPPKGSEGASSPDHRGRRKSTKAVRGAAVGKPVQLTIFDYAASIGVALLPEAS